MPSTELVSVGAVQCLFIQNEPAGQHKKQSSGIYKEEETSKGFVLLNDPWGVTK